MAECKEGSRGSRSNNIDQVSGSPVSREQLTRISHLMADGDLSLLSELSQKQLEIVVPLVCEERRNKLLKVIAKVIFDELKIN